MRLRFTIRDLLWLTVVAGLSVALWISRRNLAELNERYSTFKGVSVSYDENGKKWIRYAGPEGTFSIRADVNARPGNR